MNTTDNRSLAKTLILSGDTITAKALLQASRNMTAAEADAFIQSVLSPAASATAPIVESPLMQAALAAVSRGWFVFALKERGKEPDSEFSPHGFNSSTDDPAVVRQIWTKKPNANYGIDLGRSNLTVLDFDNGRPAAELGLVPTLQVSTSRGTHVYYSGVAKQSKMRVNDALLGDIKSGGGYVLGAGCVHPSGAVYSIVLDAPIAPVPSLDNLRGVSESKPVNVSLDGPRVPRGEHDDTLLKMARKLRGVMGLDEEDIYNHLVKLVETRFEDYGTDYLEMCGKHAKSAMKFQPNPPSGLALTLGQAAAQAQSLVLPRSALASSYLGQLYDEVFAPNGWPVELALPALATAASVLIPKPEGEGIQLNDLMTSLYTALIAPVHGGKSQVEEWASKSLSLYSPTRNKNYTRVKFGSAEQMWKYLHRHSAMEKPQDPKSFSGAVLINPDEWSHVMAKAGIPDASLASTLTSAFYQRSHTVTLSGPGGGRDIAIPFPFSIIGGIVRDDFDSVFSASTLGGLYDRFLFGLAPEGFNWSYRPFPADHPFLKNKPKAVAPRADSSFYEVGQQWKERDKELGRIVEVCQRVATIFAGIDGRKEVTGADLEALWPLALYQKAIRGIYKPNAGTNPDAIFSNAALNWVNQHAKEWRTVRDLQTGTNYYRRKLGPNVAYRALQGLAASGEVNMWVSKLVEKDGKTELNDLPAGYTGMRPKMGGGLVKAAHPE